MRHRNDGLSRLVDETLAGRRSRREVVRRATALGLSAPLVAAGLTQQRRGAAAAAQDATPAAAPPSGDPILIGAAVSTTGSNGRTGLYQQEAYLLWEEQKNAAGGLLGRPVQMVHLRRSVRSGNRRPPLRAPADRGQRPSDPWPLFLVCDPGRRPGDRARRPTDARGRSFGRRHLGTRVPVHFRRLLGCRGLLQGHHLDHRAGAGLHDRRDHLRRHPLPDLDCRTARPRTASPPASRSWSTRSTQPRRPMSPRC